MCVAKGIESTLNSSSTLGIQEEREEIRAIPLRRPKGVKYEHDDGKTKVY